MPGLQAAAAHKGRIVWSHASGLADLERGVPVTKETRFGVGSVSKSLTMAAALALQDEGLFDIDAPIERWIEDYAHGGRGITSTLIGALLAGLSDELNTTLR
ncbi:MAG: serine hydrolase domain-containing protein, partial [Planctomycetota bacterium]